MVIFPEVAKAAQMELDRVCGDRLPSLDDLSDLPYIHACVKESLRWMPGFMLGIPHATAQHDNYLGYYIPKGATVIINVWSVKTRTSQRALPILLPTDVYTGPFTITQKDIRHHDSSIPCATSMISKHPLKPQITQTLPSETTTCSGREGADVRACT